MKPHKSHGFAEFVVSDLLSGVDDVRYRAMFGGYGIYKGEVMFGLIAEDELYFKVTDDNRREYEDAGSQPFVYTGHKKPVTISYWLVPAEVIDDHKTVTDWAMDAYKAARRAKK